ncbi:MAG: TerB family tellurite resistance protein [Pseudomonadota bacterium]
MSVLDRLTRLFSAAPVAPEPKPLPPTDVPHALGALLVRVAKADNHYAVQEISQIDRVLARLQGLGPIEAAKLRADCERLETFAPGTDEFAHLLCRLTSYQARLDLTEALWEVVYADGATHQAEVDMMQVTQDHLAIQPDDCSAARAKAKAALSSRT